LGKAPNLDRPHTVNKKGGPPHTIKQPKRRGASGPPVVAHSTHNATLADATLASEKKTRKPRAATSKKYARDAFLQLRIW